MKVIEVVSGTAPAPRAGEHKPQKPFGGGGLAARQAVRAYWWASLFGLDGAGRISPFRPETYRPPIPADGRNGWGLWSADRGAWLKTWNAHFPRYTAREPFFGAPGRPSLVFQHQPQKHGSHRKSTETALGFFRVDIP